MVDRDAIKEIVFGGIDRISEELEDDEKIPKSNDTILFGKGAELDSMLFVNLIVAIEEAIAERFDQEITLAFEKVIYAENPLVTVRQFVNHIAWRLEEDTNE